VFLTLIRLRIAVPNGNFQGEIVEAHPGQQLHAMAWFAGGADGGNRNARVAFAAAYSVVHAGVVGEKFGGAERAPIGHQDGEALPGRGVTVAVAFPRP